ncbi:protein FAM72A isoform X1 [Melanerpes formicivorus]|uniref:protein FAM72A isoform X1 n=1 Tax=Melanerpes formicivorus TaxID=211600 RepID=UPI00358FA607
MEEQNRPDIANLSFEQQGEVRAAGKGRGEARLQPPRKMRVGKEEINKHGTRRIRIPPGKNNEERKRGGVPEGWGVDGPGLRDAAPHPASGSRCGETTAAAAAARQPLGGLSEEGRGPGGRAGRLPGRCGAASRSRASSGRWRPPPGLSAAARRYPAPLRGTANQQRPLPRNDRRSDQPRGSISPLGSPLFPPPGTRGHAPPGWSGRGRA